MGGELFKVETQEKVSAKTGYKFITCTNRQWNDHVLTAHSVMENLVEDVKETLRNPAAVWTSSTNADRHVYFGASSTRVTYTKVIVQLPDGKSETGQLITTFPVPEMKGNVKDVIYICKS